MKGINTKDLPGCDHSLHWSTQRPHTPRAWKSRAEQHVHRSPFPWDHPRGWCRQILSHLKCRMLGDVLSFQHRCRHVDVDEEEQPRQQHSTLRGDAPPAALGPFPPSYLLAHPCSASLPAASATPNLLGRSSSFVNHPQVHREDPSWKMTQPQGKRNHPIKTPTKPNTTTTTGAQQTACTGKQQLKNEFGCWQKQGEVRAEHKRKNSHSCSSQPTWNMWLLLVKGMSGLPNYCVWEARTLLFTVFQSLRGERKKKEHIYICQGSLYHKSLCPSYF